MIAFTSQQAARWTLNALLQQELMGAFSYSKTLMAWKNSLSEVRYTRPLLTTSIGQIPVSFFILPSPSSRSPESYEAKKQVYRAVLFEIKLVT